MRILKLYLLCIAAGGLLLPAFAVLMRPLPIEELTQKADFILNGTVASKTSLVGPNGGIYTRVELNVTEAWKGNLTSNSFVIVLGGGTVGDTRVEVSGQVEYEVGEEVVAFLVLSPKGDGVTIGLSQGKFEISTDPETGEKLAHNPFHGLAAAAAKAAAHSQGKAPGVLAERLTLAQLKQRVANSK